MAIASGASVVVSGLSLVGAAPAMAQDVTFTVTTEDDVVDANDGVLSLREAVDAAGHFDIVEFHENVIDIEVSADQIVVDTSITIQGPGSGDLTIHPDEAGTNGYQRLFYLKSPATAVVISGLTIQDFDTVVYDEEAEGVVGGAGGAIYSKHVGLTLRDVTLSGNTGGDGGAVRVNGRFNEVDLTIEDSRFTSNHAYYAFGSYGYGGAVAATTAGAVTITNSIFHNNAASFGGAVRLYLYEGGTLTISEDETFAGDDAAFEGNISEDDGGAVLVTGMAGTVTIDGPTFLDNVAGYEGGAISAEKADLTIRDTTMSGNTSGDGGGGAVHFDGVYTGYDPYEPTYVFHDLTIEDSSFEANITDGDGGAVELETGGSVVISNTSFVDNEAPNGDGGGGGALAADLNEGATMAISGGETDDGATVFDSNTAERGGALNLRAGARVDVTIDADFTDNDAADTGGAMVLRSGEDVESVEDRATITIQDSTISGNRADDDGNDANGGALYVDVSGLLSIVDSTFSGNTATGAGGALQGRIDEFAAVEITGATIVENQALYVSADEFTDGDGGAIALGLASDGSLLLSESTVSDNTAGGGGGALFVALGGESSMVIEDSTIDGNAAQSYYGGGAHLYAGADATVRIDRTTISSNTARGGGGLFLAAASIGDQAAVFTIASSTISGNEASEHGGGIYAFRDADTSIVHSTIIDNRAGAGGDGAGGGIRAHSRTRSTSGSEGSQVALSHTIVAGNDAPSAGTDDLSLVDDHTTGTLTDPAEITATWSLLGDAGESGITGGVDDNIVGEDPLLGALTTDNGGDTATHLPEAGSPVIDAGDESIDGAPDEDQRGEDRTVGVIDIGAVEVQSAATTTPPPPAVVTPPTTTPPTTTPPTTTPPAPPRPPAVATPPGGSNRPVFVVDGTPVEVPLPPGLPPGEPFASVAVSPTESIVVMPDGRVFSTNPIHNRGDIPRSIRLQARIVGLGLHWTREGPSSSSFRAAAEGDWVPSGYWLLGADGGVFSFGTARFHGSTGAMDLHQPVVALTPTASGKGYWLVAADGGVFSFGDAAFHGSTGDLKLAAPVVSMVPTASGRGYWLVAADGGVFTFGDALFRGSAATTGRSFTGAMVTESGRGYWLLEADGTRHPFGDAVG